MNAVPECVLFFLLALATCSLRLPIFSTFLTGLVPKHYTISRKCIGSFTVFSILKVVQRVLLFTPPSFQTGTQNMLIFSTFPVYILGPLCTHVQSAEWIEISENSECDWFVNIFISGTYTNSCFSIAVPIPVSRIWRYRKSQFRGSISYIRVKVKSLRFIYTELIHKVIPSPPLPSVSSVRPWKC